MSTPAVARRASDARQNVSSAGRPARQRPPSGSGLRIVAGAVGRTFGLVRNRGRLYVQSFRSGTTSRKGWPRNRDVTDESMRGIGGQVHDGIAALASSACSTGSTGRP